VVVNIKTEIYFYKSYNTIQSPVLKIQNNFRNFVFNTLLHTHRTPAYSFLMSLNDFYLSLNTTHENVLKLCTISIDICPFAKEELSDIPLDITGIKIRLKTGPDWRVVDQFTFRFITCSR